MQRAALARRLLNLPEAERALRAAAGGLFVGAHGPVVCVCVRARVRGRVGVGVGVRLLAQVLRQRSLVL